MLVELLEHMDKERFASHHARKHISPSSPPSIMIQGLWRLVTWIDEVSSPYSTSQPINTPSLPLIYIHRKEDLSTLSQDVVLVMLGVRVSLRSSALVFKEVW